MAWYLLGPDFVGVNEEVRIRIPELLTPLGSILATLINPSGLEYDVSGSLRSLNGPIITGKELVYTFGKKGNWLIRIYDNPTGLYIYHNVMAHDWPINIDMKMTDVYKIKTETERLRSVLRNENKKYG